MPERMINSYEWKHYTKDCMDKQTSVLVGKHCSLQFQPLIQWSRGETESVVNPFPWSFICYYSTNLLYTYEAILFIDNDLFNQHNQILLNRDSFQMHKK